MVHSTMAWREGEKGLALWSIGLSLLLHILLLLAGYLLASVSSEELIIQEITLVDAGSLAPGRPGGAKLDISEEGATYINRELTKVRKRLKQLDRTTLKDLQDMQQDAPLGGGGRRDRKDELTSEFGSGSLVKAGTGSGFKLDVKGRRLLFKRMPEYPEWAEEQAVEGKDDAH